MTAISQVFRQALMRKFNNASGREIPYIDVNSGELHRIVGNYPGPAHRMPVCCQIMYDEMRGNDEIISAPPKGNGASLTVRYRLPR